MKLHVNNFDKNQVVFEQFANYGHYLSGSHQPNEIVLPSETSLQYFVNEDEIVFIVNPHIQPEDYPVVLALAESKKTAKFKFFSENQAESCEENLSTLGFGSTVRSANEVFYGIDELSKLNGGKYSKLRNKKKIIERVPFVYEDLSQDNISEALLVVNGWKKARGSVYAQDRTANEASVVRAIADGSCDGTKGILQYSNSEPCGISVFDTSRDDTAIILFLKGLKHEEAPETKFSATALYFYIFNFCRDHSIPRVNDGDLGLEAGTVQHKMNFHPVAFTKTYDFIRTGK